MDAFFLDILPSEEENNIKNSAKLWIDAVRGEESMKKILLVTLVFLMISSAAVFAAQPREGIRVGLMTGLDFHIGAMAEYNFGVASASAALGYGSTAFKIGRAHV